MTFSFIVQHDLSSSYLRHIRELMAHAISNMDPIPSSILDEILRHFTPTVMTENEGGAKLAIQLVNDIAVSRNRSDTTAGVSIRLQSFSYHPHHLSIDFFWLLGSSRTSDCELVEVVVT